MVDDSGTSLLERADRLAGRLLAPLDLVARAPRALVLLLVIALAILPYVFHEPSTFRTDDYLLVATGTEHGILRGLWRDLTTPFGNTTSVDFYRPLFSWSFCVDGNLFGANPMLYLGANLSWHALAAAAGYALFRRVLGARLAFYGVLVWLAMPWACNNVIWYCGRCATAASLFLWLAALAYMRHRDAGRRGRRWMLTVYLFSALGLGFRETAMLIPALAVLIDVAQGRVDLRTIRDWCIVSVPVGLYVVVRRLVIGSWSGAYTKVADVRGPTLGEERPRFDFAEVGRQWLDIFVPGRTDVGPTTASSGIAMDALRLGAFACLGALVLLACVGRRGPGRGLVVLGGFLLVHTAGHLVARIQVWPSISQRYVTMSWAACGTLAALASLTGTRHVGPLLCVMLAVSGALRLGASVDRYDRSSDLLREIHRQVEATAEQTVFLYNVPTEVRGTPFMAICVGQTQAPPFRADGKTLYGINSGESWTGGPPQGSVPARVMAASPLAPWLLASGERVAVLWVDEERGTVERVPDGPLVELARKLDRVPAIELVEDGSDPNVIACRVEKDEILRIYVHTSMVTMNLARSPVLDYTYGSFQSGVFREQLTPALTVAALAGTDDTRAWAWVAARPGDGSPGVRISRFVELRVPVRRR